MSLKIILALKIIEFPHMKSVWRELFIFLNIFPRSPGLGFPMNDDLLIEILMQLKKKNHFHTDHLFYALEICAPLTMWYTEEEQLEVLNLYRMRKDSQSAGKQG